MWPEPQFQALLQDDLWLRSAAHANAMAARIRDGLSGLGIPVAADSPTNQLFPILPNAKYEALARGFSHCKKSGQWAPPPK